MIRAASRPAAERATLYRKWLEHNTYVTALIYCGLIGVLLPAFHYALQPVPGVPPDSLSIRLVAAAVAAIVAALLIFSPAAKRHVEELHFFNVMVGLLVTITVVVNSGDHYAFIGAGLLVLIAAQQAFYRPRDLAIALIAGFGFQIGYSYLHGIFFTPINLATLMIYGSGYVIAYVPAYLRMRIQDSEIKSRLEAHRMREELEQIAGHDALTGLPNRWTFSQRLTARLSKPGTRLAVLFLDLDHFKDVNDTLGHAVGDALLCAVSDRIAMLVPPASLLARWGGDEFLLLLQDTNPDEARTIGRDLVLGIAEPFAVSGYDLTITSSVGIACSPDHASDAAVLIRNADIAMYHAKQTPSKCLAFEASMHEVVASRHRVRNELHRAVSAGELTLYYQPIITIATAEITGAEALLRWNGPDGVLRYPGEFIEIAEDTGEIIRIGTWALHAACVQLEAWQSRGFSLRLSVNVSARQLEHPEFVGTLKLILRQTQIDPGALEIEVTETALLASSAFETLAHIRALGPSIGLDDFATGYCSFAYLKRHAVNALKVDRTFVSGIDRPDDRAIAESIIRVARSLGLRTVAEGVETPEQLEILRDMGCDQAQGYLIAKALPVDQFERVLAESSAKSIKVWQASGERR